MSLWSHDDANLSNISDLPMLKTHRKFLQDKVMDALLSWLMRKPWALIDLRLNYRSPGTLLLKTSLEV